MRGTVNALIRQAVILAPHAQTLNGSRQAKMCLRAYVDRESPDQLEHPRSLIRAIAVPCQNHWTLWNVSMESKGPDETLRMRKMT